MRIMNAISDGQAKNPVSSLMILMRFGRTSVQLFNEVIGARGFQADDVAAGRAYVKAYVEFIHYVERVYEATTATAHGHFDETEPAAQIR